MLVLRYEGMERSISRLQRDQRKNIRLMDDVTMF